MKLDCSAKIEDGQERQALLLQVKNLARGYSEIGETVYASYFGNDKVAVREIISLFAKYQDHTIELRGGDKG